MRSLLLIAVVGCASAGTGQSDDDDQPVDAPRVDAPINDPDAAVDSAPIRVTLSQTTSPNITAGNTVNCNDGLTTDENSYYRVFPLAQSGITGTFTLENVSFGVESATSGAGNSQTATINVGSYAGAIAANTATLDLTQVTQLATVTATIPNGDGGTVTTPIAATLPPNSKLFVEILSPAAGNIFFLGSNTGGESFPGFIRAPACGTGTPSNYSTTVGATVHAIITVTGTH